MADTERLKQRLQAITQERRSQEKIESMNRELEVDRLLLRQMKRRSLRERWLLEGSINSSMDSESHEHCDMNNRISEAQKLQEKINRRQLEIEHLELTAQQNTLLKKHPEASPQDGTQVFKGAQGEDVISGSDTVSPGAAESDSRALDVDESPAVVFTINSERVQELSTNSKAPSIPTKGRGGLCAHGEQGDERRLDDVWNKGGCQPHCMGITRRKAPDVECSNACLRLEQNPGIPDRSGVENMDLPGSCSNSARCQAGAGSSLEERGDGVHVEMATGAGRMQDASGAHLNQDQVLKQQQTETTATLCGKAESLVSDPNINLHQSLNIHGAADLEARTGMHNTVAVGPCLEDKEPLGHLSPLTYSVVPEGGSRRICEGMIKAELVLIADDAGEAGAVDHEMEDGSRTELVEQEEEGHGSGGEERLEEAPACSPADSIDVHEGDGGTEPRGGSENLSEAGARDSQLGKPKLHGLLLPELRNTQPTLPKVEDGVGSDGGEGVGSGLGERVGCEREEERVNTEIEEGVDIGREQWVAGGLEESAGSGLGKVEETEKEEGKGTPNLAEGLGTEVQVDIEKDQRVGTGMEVGVVKGKEARVGEEIDAGIVGADTGLEDAAGTGQEEGVGHDLGMGLVAEQGRGLGSDREGVVGTVFEEGAAPEGVGTERELGVGAGLGEGVAIHTEDVVDTVLEGGVDIPQVEVSVELGEGVGSGLGEVVNIERVGETVGTGLGAGTGQWEGVGAGLGAGTGQWEGVGAGLEGVGNMREVGVGIEQGEVSIELDKQVGIGPEEVVNTELGDGVGSGLQEGLQTGVGEGVGGIELGDISIGLVEQEQGEEMGGLRLGVGTGLAEEGAHTGPEEVTHTGPEELIHTGPEEGPHTGPEEGAHTGPEELIHTGPEEGPHTGPEELIHTGPEGLTHTGPEEGVGNTGPEELIHTGPEEGAHTGPEEGAHTGPEELIHTGPEGLTHTGPEGLTHTGPEEGVGNTGPEELIHTGPEGLTHTGPEEGAHTGPEELIHTGPEGLTHTGPEEGAHTGPEEGAHTGPEELIHTELRPLLPGPIPVAADGRVRPVQPLPTARLLPQTPAPRVSRDGAVTGQTGRREAQPQSRAPESDMRESASNKGTRCVCCALM